MFQMNSEISSTGEINLTEAANQKYGILYRLVFLLISTITLRRLNVQPIATHSRIPIRIRLIWFVQLSTISNHARPASETNTIEISPQTAQTPIVTVLGLRWNLSETAAEIPSTIENAESIASVMSMR